MLAHGAKICHILSDKEHCTNVYDVRSIRGAETECDHFLVGAKISRMRKLIKMK